MIRQPPGSTRTDTLLPCTTRVRSRPSRVSSPLPEALISAAERLFAERGSEAVSLREINTAAGSTNASAIQYHFGGRRGLVKAVLAKHEVDIERRDRKSTRLNSSH